METTETHNPPKRFRLVSAGGVLRAALVVVLFPVAGLFGDHHWTLDLFNHFQAQYFCLLLAALLTLAVLRSRGRALICLALLAIPAVRLAPLYLPAGANDTGGPRLRVASFNILGTNTRYAKAAEWIQISNPDFIYLPETNPEWGAGLAPLNRIYPHRVDEFIEGNFGFSFRSKFPLVRHEIHHPGVMEIPLLHAVVATPHGEVTLFGAHPVPPVTAFWANERDVYLKQLSNLAAKTRGRTIILGDLNATRWSRCLAPWFDQGFKDSADGRGFSATWMRENPLMAIPIDHIFTRGFSGVLRRETGPALGSDHRPVIAYLAW